MRRVALDSNFVVLFVIGSVSVDLIGRHKRLRAFREQDFELLVERIAGVELVTTPNIMTESSNLVGQGLYGALKKQTMLALKSFCDQTSESYVRSRDAAIQPEYARLGMTDAAWLALLDGSTTLLTVDLDLYLAAAARGLAAENFNHVRDAA